MKKWICWLLIIVMLFGTTGCTKKEPEIQEPVSFYYLRSTLTFETDIGVIHTEIREAKGYEHDIPGLLRIYLAGPVTDAYARTFPDGTALVNFATNEDRAYVQLSSHFASLTGMDLTIACACLTMTIIELTNVTYVEIQAKGATLQDAESIVMDKNCLLLLDDGAIEPAD